MPSMLTTILISLAAVVAAGWVNSRARVVVAFAAIVGGGTLIVTSGSTPQAALGASVLMASGSVALGSLYLRPKLRVAFGSLTAVPFAFVAFAAWPLMRANETSEVGTNLVLLALAGVGALVALSAGGPARSKEETGD